MEVRGILTSKLKTDYYVILSVLTGIDLYYGNSHFGKSSRNICNYGNIVICIYLSYCLKYADSALLDLCKIPFSSYPTMEELLRLHSVYYVGTIVLMDRNAVTLCNKSDNGVAGERITAFCKFKRASALRR